MTFEFDEARVGEEHLEKILRMIERLKHAHYTTLLIRINGRDERFDGDWIKYLRPVGQ